MKYLLFKISLIPRRFLISKLKGKSLLKDRFQHTHTQNAFETIAERAIESKTA